MVISPPIVWIGVHEKPGASVGTIRIEMPACFFASGSVRAASQMYSASLAWVVKIFWPLITHSVAVALGAGLERGEIGAGARLGVADADQQLAIADLRQQLGLLRLRTPLHQHGTHGVHGDHRKRRAGAVGLVPEDELVEVAATLAAVLLGPADHQPAIAPHPPHGLAKGRTAELVPLLVEGLAQVGREELAVVVAELAPERLLVGREVDVHGSGGSN